MLVIGRCQKNYELLQFSKNYGFQWTCDLHHSLKCPLHRLIEKFNWQTVELFFLIWKISEASCNHVGIKAHKSKLIFWFQIEESATLARSIGEYQIWRDRWSNVLLLIDLSISRPTKHVFWLHHVLEDFFSKFNNQIYTLFRYQDPVMRIFYGKSANFSRNIT